MATTFLALRKLCGRESPNPIAVARLFDTATDKMWREYEPEELFVAAGVHDGYRKDLLCATLMAVTNPDCFDDWHAFHHVATSFNHRSASFEFLDAISFMEAAWTCHVLRTLRPNFDFGLGVRRYIAALCLNDGVLFFPWIGGDGLNLCTFYPMKGLLDPSLCGVVDKVICRWKSGALENLEPSDVDDTDVEHVQVAKIVNAQEYIRRSIAS